MTRTIHVAHSPDSDDAFMFYALAEGKIDTGDLRYVHELSDIESLNQRALPGGARGDRGLDPRLRLSLARRTPCSARGSSMGDGYGPRLVAKSPAPADPRAALRGPPGGRPGQADHGVPGAPALSAGHASPVVMPFDRIEDAVAPGRRGRRAADPRGPAHLRRPGPPPLGLTWARGGCEDTGLPLPLGGNVVRRDLGRRGHRPDRPGSPRRASCTRWSTARRPWRTPASSTAASATSAPTRFVGMYVNEWTVDYGPRGRAGGAAAARPGREAGLIPERVQVEFVDRVIDLSLLRRSYLLGPTGRASARPGGASWPLPGTGVPVTDGPVSLLVVDDEEAIRRPMRKYLTLQGYEVGRRGLWRRGSRRSWAARRSRACCWT